VPQNLRPLRPKSKDLRLQTPSESQKLRPKEVLGLTFRDLEGVFQVLAFEFWRGSLVSVIEIWRGSQALVFETRRGIIGISFWDSKGV